VYPEARFGKLAPPPQPKMSSAEGHSSRADLEAAAFGQLSDADEAAVEVHAAQCQRCGSLLAEDVAVRQMLARLASYEPHIDVVAQVLARIDTAISRSVVQPFDPAVAERAARRRSKPARDLASARSQGR
jgi:anti-sigma factor RsiW